MMPSIPVKSNYQKKVTEWPESGPTSRCAYTWDVDGRQCADDGYNEDVLCYAHRVAVERELQVAADAVLA